MIVTSYSLMYNTCMGTQWNMSESGRKKISDFAQKRYKNNSKIVNCLRCKKEYKVPLSRWLNGRGRYCSKDCMTLDFQGKHLAPQTEFKKGTSPWNKGLEMPRGADSATWKGDRVGYDGLHRWMIRTYGRKDACLFCGSGKRLDLANKTGIYNREPENWITLCRKCHIEFDRKNPKNPPFELRKGW